MQSVAVVFVIAIRSCIFYGPKGHCCPAPDQRRRGKYLLKSPVVPLYGSSTDGPGNGMFNLDWGPYSSLLFVTPLIR